MAYLFEVVRTQHFKVVLQVALLLVFALLLCFSLLRTEWIGTPVISLIVICIISINLVRLVEKGYRDFTQFINNITHSDFTSSYGSSDKIFSEKEFVEAQKALLAKYQELKNQRTVQTEYLQMVVEHIDAALICFDDEGEIEIKNESATRLLGRKYVSSLKIIVEINPVLHEKLSKIQPGETQIVKLNSAHGTLQLLMNATRFSLFDRRYKLVSLQNINYALDEREIESWRKLIRVLTHEIMNSMTPIISLSRYVESTLKENSIINALAQDEPEKFNDLQRSIDAIATRSQGLMDFVNSYRSLNNLPEPIFEEFAVSDLFSRVELLFGKRFEEEHVMYRMNIEPSSLTLIADANLLEQVMINLVNNAIEAVAGRDEPRIEISAGLGGENKASIHIKDNGEGISDDIIDDVFTPFFTTKDAGSGIGLSLSRQLARLNRASLSVRSTKGVGSDFTLSF